MRLENDQQFVTIGAPQLGGPAMTLPADVAGTWSVLLFYRGHW